VAGGATVGRCADVFVAGWRWRAGVYIPAAAAEGIVGRISCFVFWGRKKKLSMTRLVNWSLVIMQ
jgi:hypothetical protein